MHKRTFIQTSLAIIRKTCVTFILGTITIIVNFFIIRLVEVFKRLNKILLLLAVFEADISSLRLFIWPNATSWSLLLFAAFLWFLVRMVLLFCRIVASTKYRKRTVSLLCILRVFKLPYFLDSRWSMQRRCSRSNSKNWHFFHFRSNCFVLPYNCRVSRVLDTYTQRLVRYGYE